MRSWPCRFFIVLITLAFLAAGQPQAAGAAEITLDEALEKARDSAFSVRRSELHSEGFRLDESFAKDTYDLLSDQQAELEGRKTELKDELQSIERALESLYRELERLGEFEERPEEEGPENDIDNNNANDDDDNNDNDNKDIDNKNNNNSANANTEENVNQQELQRSREAIEREIALLRAQRDRLTASIAMLEIELDEGEWGRRVDRAQEAWRDAERELEWSEDDIEVARILSAAQARRAYVEILLLEQQLAWESENYLGLQERKERLKRKQQLGLEPEIALEQLEAEERDREWEWQDVKGQLVVARQYLNYVMGVEPARKIQVVPFAVSTRRVLDIEEGRERFLDQAQVLERLQEHKEHLEEKIALRDQELRDLERDGKKDELEYREVQYERDRLRLEIRLLDLERHEIEAGGQVELQETYQRAREQERAVEKTRQDYRDALRDLERLVKQHELGLVAAYEIDDFKLQLSGLENTHQQALYQYYLAVEEFLLEQKGLQPPADVF